MPRPLPSVVATVVAVALSSCGHAPTQQQGEGGKTVTITSCGKRITVPQPARRAVTTEQGATEMLLALGAQSQVAGQSNVKTQVPDRWRAANRSIKVLNPKLLTGEQLRSADPDVVVSPFREFYSADQLGTRDELAQLKIAPYQFELDCPAQNPGRSALERVRQDMLNLGRIFGREKQAAALVAEQKKEIGAAERLSRTFRGHPRVLWLYAAYEDRPYVAGRQSLPQDLSDRTGTRNAFADLDDRWPQASWEQIAARKPDVIVLADLSSRGRPGDTPAEKIKMLRTNPATKDLEAVRKNRFITVDAVSMDASPRSSEALRTYVTGLQRFQRQGWTPR